ncbi:MAG: tyrosine-type recombinase/integrase [Acidobacteriia bacterium]|nr:tyrosine-type recombinase/integrase [Terriglobia bacterium]
MGVDREKPDQERTSKCEAYEDARCSDARRDHGTSQANNRFGQRPSGDDTGDLQARRRRSQKRVGFHTFRHTYTTLLTQNNEEVKVVQELLRHANSRITLDLYAQAGMPNKRLAPEQTCSASYSTRERHRPNWTKLDRDGNCRFLGSA